MQRSTKALTSAENIDIGLSEGNALLVQLTGTGSPDGTVDFKSTIDGATYNNTPYIAKDSVTASKSVAQLSSITTATTYIILPPMTQARIAVASLTSGTISIAWREIEYSRPFDGTLGEFSDDEKVTFGDDGDVVLMLRSTALSADEELTDVIEGTSDHQGVAANSLLLSNITNDGDVLMLVSDGGSSKEFLLANADSADLVLGHGMSTVNLKTASGDVTLTAGDENVFSGTTSNRFSTLGVVDDDVRFAVGTTSDTVLFNRSTALSADAEISNVIVGTSNHQGVAANSLIVSNITTDGDIIMLVSDGGNSLEVLLANGDTGDLVLGHGMATVNLKTASGDIVLTAGDENVFSGTTSNRFSTLGVVDDDVRFALGSTADTVLVNRSTALSADAELTSVIVGTSNHQGVAANSLVLSNITSDGDIIMLVSDGGNSLEFLLANADAGDLQIGHGMATVSVKTASGNLILAPGGSTVTTITTGQILNVAGSVSAPGYSFTGGGAADDGMFSEGGGVVTFAADGAKQLRLRSSDAYFYQDVYIQGNHFEMNEMSAPGAGGTDTARIYAVADGGGLTDLVAVFQDGTTDVFAQETTPLDAATFTEDSGTDLTLKLKKLHPGSVQIVCIFPGGEEFVLKDIQYHDPEKIAANKGTTSADLPAGWLVEDATQRAARVALEKKE